MAASPDRPADRLLYQGVSRAQRAPHRPGWWPVPVVGVSANPGKTQSPGDVVVQRRSMTGRKPGEPCARPAAFWLRFRVRVAPGTAAGGATRSAWPEWSNGNGTRCDLSYRFTVSDTSSRTVAKQRCARNRASLARAYDQKSRGCTMTRKLYLLARGAVVSGALVAPAAEAARARPRRRRAVRVRRAPPRRPRAHLLEAASQATTTSTSSTRRTSSTTGPVNTSTPTTAIPPGGGAALVAVCRRRSASWPPQP